MFNSGSLNIKKTFKKYMLRSLIMAFLVFALMSVFSLSSLGKSVNPDRENEVKDKLEKILSSKEFTDPQMKKSILERLAEMINDFIDSIMEKMPQGSENNAKRSFDTGTSAAAVLAFKVFAVLIIIGFIFLIVLFILRNFHTSKKIKQEEDAELLTVLKDSDAVEQTALEFYYKGDFRQGIRYLYISFLLRLNELNVIRIDKSKTNKQYLREMEESGYEYYEVAREFTQDFNRYWYGNKNVDKAKFDYWYNNYTSLLKEVVK